MQTPLETEIRVHAGEGEVVMAMSTLERMLLMHIRLSGLDDPECEYKFHPRRRWRFDYAWPDVQLAVECEGGVWSRGRHTRGQGFINDCDKYNSAALMGWRVLRFTREHIETGAALAMIEDALGV